MVGTSLPLASQTGWLPARDCGGQQHGVSGGRRLPSALEAASPLGTSVCTALPCRDPSAVAVFSSDLISYSLASIHRPIPVGRFRPDFCTRSFPR
jgi:hypothetical protein